MSTTFYRGQVLGRQELNIYLVNASKKSINAADITYAVYDFTTGQEVLVGPLKRDPANPAIGEYYASFTIPTDANLGDYRIRWTFKEMIGGTPNQVVQEFSIIDKAGLSTTTASLITGNAVNASLAEMQMMGRLRILLRDNSPDRNYRFRPPTHEETVQQYSRVFGYIWEDVELQEYLQRAVDQIGASPPATPFRDLNSLVTQHPEWRTLVLTGAMVWALQALQINWISEEFSLVGETEVTVLVGNEEIVVTLEDLYGLLELGSNESVVHGEKLRKAFVEGSLKVKSVSPTGHVHTAIVYNVLRHHTEYKHIYAVRVASSMAMVTGDHSLFLKVDGGVLPVKADELRVGDSLAVVRDGVTVGESIESLILLEPRQYTYDLSVPGPENFVLTNGILAHNSYSIGGVSLDLEKSSKYQSAMQSTSEQFDKQLDQAKKTVKIIRGLQQSRYSIGIRSAFGPALGAGNLTPAKFIGM